MSMFDKNITQEKLKSLEFAESQRQESWQHPSFALGLFHGELKLDLIDPFPTISNEEKVEGDLYLAQMEKFLRENLNPDEVDRTGLIPEKVYQGLTQLKAFALKIPKEYGGMGFSQYNYNRIMHLVSSFCGSTAVLLSAHQSIGVPQPLKLFGTDEQKKKFLPRFAKGAISAFALTEPTVGSDPREMLTTATPIDDGKNYLLNGEKLWCTNGLIADLIVVMAVTPPKIVKGKEIKQITAFIVEANSPGIEKVQRCEFMGLHGIQNGLMRFNNVKVPAENIILGLGEGLRLALTTLNTGRLTLPAASAGIGKWCLNVARQHATKRRQWGLAVGEHEAIAQKLSYIATHTFAMDAMTWLTSAMADDKHRDIRLEAAIAKLFCTEVSWKITDETLQIRGGQGYETASSLAKRGMDYWPVERVLRDVRINRIIEGTTEIMHLFIAREALDPHLAKIKPLLSAKTPPMSKLIAGLKMIGFYAFWYPKVLLPPIRRATGHLPTPLDEHMFFVKTASRQLARVTFYNMMRYQQKLESKQSILNRIVSIGVELFAIAATCSYATHLSKQGQVNAIDLADGFVKSSQERVNILFNELSHNQDKTHLTIARKLLHKDYEWLENTIIK